MMIYKSRLKQKRKKNNNIVLSNLKLNNYQKF
jgi:hypothetical protein